MSGSPQPTLHPQSGIDDDIREEHLQQIGWLLGMEKEVPLDAPL